MKYAIKKSDVMMFVIRRDRYIKIANYKIIKRVSNVLNVRIEDIETNYMNYIENLWEKATGNERKSECDRCARNDGTDFVCKSKRNKKAKCQNQG